ncbi:scyllo-inositol 2-dehydrogenase (NADP+) [Parabacteroides sp. PFB2-10]|uniref:Gfo/Idh/MocA family oxidoreductase n=1 Tax=Parabacteroides sp. PFB2-10 TaxID=1742405 RepID=UPI0024749910|nr:Gfo/Idh/MocA family oxidoreductase [Parabacteroides sp. PFB2-10]MDH6312162.1 scyllo-inositol 2-dehydrogenase (NADP+) [Parabacteroides sp. PFB2-10]
MQKIITGLASYGMSGSVFHAPFLDVHPGFELHTIVERSKNLARARYPHVQIVRSFEALLDIPEIQLVVVNTPDTTHYDYVKLALLAGKHVVVEKPFVFDVSQGEELVRLARKSGLVLAVYQNRRWDGDFLTVKKILESGVLGRVVEFQSAFQRYRNFIQPGTWKEKADQQVGITYNLGSHMIDQAVQLFGMPQAVYADIDRLRDGSEVDDYYFIKLIYPQVKVLLRAGYLMREETPRYYLHGTEGSYVKQGLDPQEECLKQGVIPTGAAWGKEAEANWGTLNATVSGLHYRGKIETLPGNYMAFYDDIHRSVTENQKALTDAEDVLQVIRIIQASFESEHTGEVVHLEG